MDPERFQSRHRLWLIVAPIVLAAIIVLGMVAFLQLTTTDPDFPVLADNPDPALQGTVAYFDVGSACVRLVAAAGRPARDVLCLPATEGKVPGLFGPLLAWLPDGRLQVTAYFQAEDLSFFAGWQETIDVATGAVEETAEGDLPAAPPAVAGPAAGPNGERIESTSEGGRVEIVLTGAAGTRTLLSTRGDVDYCIEASPTWSPDGEWVVVEDCHGRILLITVAEPAVTRLLTAGFCPAVGAGRTCLAVTGAGLADPAG